MGRIDRLKTVTMARIEVFLASLEKPEAVLPQLVKEMSDRVGEAARAEAKALTAVKADRRRLDAVNGRLNRLQEGGQTRSWTDRRQAEKLDTARQAIAAQVEAERQLESYRQTLAVSESAYESAGAVRKQLQNLLKELKLRKQALLTRVYQVRQQQQFQRQRIPEARSRSLLDLIARIEAKIETEEARLEIQDQIRQTLGATFEHERVLELENDAEVNRRLEALRHSLDNETQAP